MTEVYTTKGFCPICENHVTFTASDIWYRRSLQCPACPNGSTPRERALMLLLRREFPMWPSLAVHESSPILARGASAALFRHCENYTTTRYFPNEIPGSMVKGHRNENLEAQTFDDAQFDLVVSLDVMEHVNEPAAAFREIARTLRTGGAYIFTTPTYKDKLKTERRAKIEPDGTETHYSTPEYHGSAVEARGALVTFHFGYDLPQLIYEWCGMHTRVERFWDPYHGIIGEFTEVYVCHRRDTSAGT